MSDERRINELLDAFHRAAAVGDGKAFFDIIDENQGVYIGTDQEEHWTKQAFASFAMPYFERGPAWDFTAVDRHVFVSPDHRVAWFDEWLHTWMQGCRGSGVFVKTPGGEWKMTQYVLSMTMPTALLASVVSEKAPMEKAYLLKQASEPVKVGSPQSAHVFLDGWHRAAAANDLEVLQHGLAPDAFVVGYFNDQYCRDPVSAVELFSDLSHRSAQDEVPTYHTVERHVYATADGAYAWFDELFTGTLEGFRGSGVLRACGPEAWCVQHYVLSLTIPNDMAKPLVPRKQALEGEELNQRLAARTAPH